MGGPSTQGPKMHTATASRSGLSRRLTTVHVRQRSVTVVSRHRRRVSPGPACVPRGSRCVSVTSCERSERRVVTERSECKVQNSPKLLHTIANSARLVPIERVRVTGAAYGQIATEEPSHPCGRTTHSGGRKIGNHGAASRCRRCRCCWLWLCQLRRAQRTY